MSNRMINKFIAITIFSVCMMSAVAAWAEGVVIDPDSAQHTFTITCVDPIEREDGTALTVGEIDTRNFFVSTTKEPYDWRPAGTNNAECKQVYDMSAVAEGQYYYTVTVTDTEGRESLYGVSNPDLLPGETGYVAAVVKRIHPPKTGTGLSGTVS